MVGPSAAVDRGGASTVPEREPKRLDPWEVAMTTTVDTGTTTTRPGTPTDRMLTAALIVAPLLYLAADTLYAVQGWDDATGGVLHVLGAIAYGLVVLRIATWLPTGAVLTAVLVLTGVAGAIGNAAYGFEAIHQSFGDMALVDRSGAAVLIKLLGLLFPLSMLLVAWALQRLGHRVPAVLVLVGALGWPVAHIANVGAIAVVVNLLFVVAFGSIAWEAQRD